MTRVLLALLLVLSACGNREVRPELPGLDVGDAGTDTVDIVDVVGDLEEDTNSDQSTFEVTDTESESDGADVVDPPSAYHPLFDYVGRIELLERVQHDGTFGNGLVAVRLEDAPPKVNHFEGGSQGQCIFYQSLILSPTCTPECDPIQEWCHPDGSCRTFPQRVSAGPIVFEGLQTPLSAIPDETAWYTLEPSGYTDDLFADDATISISAAGDELPAFDLKLGGVAPLNLEFEGNLTLEDGKDNRIEWVTANDGSTIEVILQTGWHGAPPTAIIWCSVPDAAGEVTIAQSLVEMFPQVPEIGLFQWPSHIRRVRRQAVETANGPLEVTTKSQVNFSTLHESTIGPLSNRDYIGANDGARVGGVWCQNWPSIVVNWSNGMATWLRWTISICRWYAASALGSWVPMGQAKRLP